MATINITADQNTAINTASGDTVIVSAGVLVNAPLDALNGFSSSDLTVDNKGILRGNLIGASVSSRSVVTNSASGVLVGSAAGLWLNGSGAVANNAGLIQSRGEGLADILAAVGLNNATGATINNSGSIVGGRAAIDMHGSTSDTEINNTGSITAAGAAIIGQASVVIDNSGEISSTGAEAINFSGDDNGFELDNSGIVRGVGTAIIGGDVADTVRNTGTISGNIRLGGGNDVYEATGLGAVEGEILGEAGDDLVVGGGNADIARGGAGSDRLFGGGGNDTLYGDAENDTLDGGAGADTLTGGAGDDTYFVDDAGDVVIEDGLDNDANDIIQSAISYALTDAQRIETLRLVNATGDADLNLTGNGFANRLIGNAGDNRLDGGAGADTLQGGRGGDTYVVDDAGDRIVEHLDAGSDTVEAGFTYSLVGAYQVENLTLTGSGDIDATGNSYANVLTGNDGDNVLNGSAGADTLTGGAGNDTYFVDDAGDVVIEDGLVNDIDDVIQSAISYALTDAQRIETLRLVNATGDADLNLTGNGFANRLIGNVGDNRLDGGAGADTLQGGRGDDTYVVDDAGDRIVEHLDAGSDTVEAGFTYSLVGAYQVENLTLTGSGDIDATGNSYANVLTGNDGDNTLNGSSGNDTLDGGAGDDLLEGGTGADEMSGGSGNDTYRVDEAGDTIIELAGDADDTVVATTSYGLAAGVDIETLQLHFSTGDTDLDLTGNEVGQTLIGNAGDNLLDGGGGADILQGGRGDDIFRFSTAPDSGNIDVIRDFKPGQDKIALDHTVFGLSLDVQQNASQFTAAQSASDTVGDEIRLVYSSETSTLYYDSDGGTATNWVAIAVLENGARLTFEDILVV